MNLFSNLDTSGIELSRDYIPNVLDSDIYKAKIDIAYIGQSSGGAISVTLAYEVSGRKFKETFYITNKEKCPYYVKDGKKIPIPGYKIINDLCLVVLGKELNDPDLKQGTKIFKIYDYSKGEEVNTEVEAILDLSGQEVYLGILKKLKNKSQKTDDGSYVDTAETKEINSINAVFSISSHMTAYELNHDDEHGAVFWDKWLAANKGKVKDERTIKEAQTASKSKSTKSLFDKEPTTSSNKEEEVETSTKLTNKLFKN